jgi:hypothetical protein
MTQEEYPPMRRGIMRSEVVMADASCWCPMDVGDADDAGDVPAVIAAAAAELEVEVPGGRPRVGADQR